MMRSNNIIITGSSGTNWTKLNSYFREKTIHGVRNVICACSLGMEICVFTLRMDFELRGWPPQPPTFSRSFDHILALLNKVEVDCSN